MLRGLVALLSLGLFITSIIAFVQIGNSNKSGCCIPPACGAKAKENIQPGDISSSGTQCYIANANAGRTQEQIALELGGQQCLDAYKAWNRSAACQRDSGISHDGSGCAKNPGQGSAIGTPIICLICSVVMLVITCINSEGPVRLSGVLAGVFFVGTLITGLISLAGYNSLEAIIEGPAYFCKNEGAGGGYSNCLSEKLTYQSSACPSLLADTNPRVLGFQYPPFGSSQIGLIGVSFVQFILAIFWVKRYEAENCSDNNNNNNNNSSGDADDKKDITSGKMNTLALPPHGADSTLMENEEQPRETAEEGYDRREALLKESENYKL